jgi:putative PIN family toxin of toxin-antitoxin system
VKVLLDTNVLLSAAFHHGVCQRILQECLANPALELIACQYLFDEFSHHAATKFKAPPELIDAFIKEVRRYATLVEPVPLDPHEFQDADDLPVLGCGVAAHVDQIVTGDKRMLRLGEFRGITLISPRRFHDRTCGG